MKTASAEDEHLLCHQIVQLFEVLYLASLGGRFLDSLKLLRHETANLPSHKPFLAGIHRVISGRRHLVVAGEDQGCSARLEGLLIDAEELYLLGQEICSYNSEKAEK